MLRRFKVAALLVVLMFLSSPTALGFLFYGLASGEYGWLPIAAGVFAAGLFFMVLNFVISSRLRCPLCMVPPLLNLGCSKHQTAETLFGSHRLTVALSILFKSSFCCPYCGEPTAMEVRLRGRR